MNVAVAPGFRGWLLPDPWTTHVPPRPDELLPYFDFVRRHVLEYTNEQVPVTNADRLRFVAFMARHGLSTATAWAIVRQLAAERLDPRHALAPGDCSSTGCSSTSFAGTGAARRPAFSTFFLNSTAHFQHFYWRNLEPERFRVRPAEDEQRAYADAVLFGYQQMDRLVGESLAMAGDDATVVLCTALSQQPCLTYEESGGKVIYRPRDFERLLAFAGVDRRASGGAGDGRGVPRLPRERRRGGRGRAAADRDARRGSSGAGGAPGRGRTLLRLQDPRRRSGKDATVSSPGGAVPFLDLFYQVEGVKSGMHHPEGTPVDPHPGADPRRSPRARCR